MKILIIEDEVRIATLIQQGLEEQEHLVVIAYDGLTGKKLALQNDYDLVISDIILPQLSGIEVCREIRLVKPDMPIILLTALGTTDDKVDGFDAGADDYLVKPFDFRELLVRIRAVMNRKIGRTTVQPVILKYADLELNNQTKTVSRSGKTISLTPKELKLLEYMMQNSERVLSRTEIAEKVWDTHFDTGTNFIDVYINYLRKKIDKDFNDKLIHTKQGLGFIFAAAK
ncbi:MULTISPECIES: response regulator transcription factor [unclassified Mucilaginibacter]|uniref:response regulator transcription factor n=1 Tax=unclassified Mucilaginibacter TaxID=2617802 RepID=UPI002AC8C502|nr:MULTISPECIES: response regulator transcription factor [unclassified Mucilaginibacter]MEB0262930.1 response regulator transcription factor [Mucilaginibacter sp. 10I4]MEB0278221.1 response regulator transcription factor [Mucilaginibacter sp. 10B2]MEB0300993.1 response regulator transcription factor [Mucilaginibacter sp. 5C4]WPX23867.1 response regulator transcription factor [Mucilaginibacter sp. 5C4]